MSERILKQICDELSPLIAFDTQNGTGDEIACAAYLRDRLQSFDPDQLIFETAPRGRGKADSAYVLAIWGNPQYLLNVHIDTVPAGEGWIQSPHKLTEQGERLIGLGTSDIKGAAACILAAMAGTVPRNIAVLFSGDEEHGSEVMQAIVQRGHYSQAPQAIVCEPTACQVGRRHRGMLAFSMRFEGPGGHSSLSDITAAPLKRVARLAAQLADYNDHHKDVGTDPYKGLCLNIGDIRGDGAYNVIPTMGELWMSMRPPPGDDVKQRSKDVQDILAQDYPDAAWDEIVCFPAFETRNIEAFASVFDPSFEIVDLPYWTEASMLSDAGVNAVVFGPGDVEQAHKPNEFVTKEQLLRATELYRRVIGGQDK